jgi:hypothetical protein
MALAKDWQDLEASLPDRWVEARIGLVLEEASDSERALALLGPLQPVRTGRGSASLRVARHGADAGPSPESLRRALQRLDAERLHGRLEVISADEQTTEEAAESGHRLPQAWDEALAALPGDWSDLLGEIELDSSDYIEPGALQLAPINPRRVEDSMRLQFRSARRFGYGASPGMVRRCLERCDAAGITGRVEVLRVLSDTRPVGTQGPVWQIEGRMV